MDNIKDLLKLHNYYIDFLKFAGRTVWFIPKSRQCRYEWKIIYYRNHWFLH